MREPFIGESVDSNAIERPVDRARGAVKPQQSRSQSVQLVRVVDFDMSIWSLTVFFLKAAIASIPAAILLSIISAIAFAAITGAIVFR